MRIEQKRQQLNFEERRESDYRRQLAETSAAISSVETHLSELREKIDAATREELRQRRLLAAALSALQMHREAYRRRLVQMYEQPPIAYPAVLLASTSFTDFVERWDDLRHIVAADQREIKTRDAAAGRVAQARAAISASIVRLQNDAGEQAQSRAQLDALARQRENLVAAAQQDRSSVATQVQQLEDISAREEAQLEQLVRAQEEELERQRAHSLAGSPATPRIGQMQWPLSGPITSPFGMRPNPFGGGNIEFHPGIDIGVAVGTTVAAAAAGRVIIAGWVSGYGNYIAIDHGGGVSTGYGHLSQFFVSVGQDVQRGQAIGASGNTGRSTGPHLIFEVRRNGSPIDPNPFLQ